MMTKWFNKLLDYGLYTSVLLLCQNIDLNPSQLEAYYFYICPKVIYI